MTMRLLCVQWANIGDLILTTPALAALREAHPGAHIGLLTTPAAAPVVRGTGLADAIYTLPRFEVFRRETARVFRQIRADHYDTLMFFHRLTTRAGAMKYGGLALSSGAKRRIGLDNGRGWFLTERLADNGYGAEHQAEAWLKLAALLGADPSPRPAVIAREPLVLPDAPKRIAVHAGSGNFSLARRWPVERLAAVVDTLAEEMGAQVVIVGAKGDDSPQLISRLQTPALDLTGQTSIPQLAGVLSQCDLYVGSDSGVTHIAATVGTPTVAVFGPTNPRAWSPWPLEGRAVVVRSAPECSPCMFVGHDLGSREGSPARTCMMMVTPEHVVTAARRLLSETPSPNQPGPAREFRPYLPLAVKVTSSSDASPSFNPVSHPHLPLSSRRDAIYGVRSGPGGEVSAPPEPIPILGLPVHPITYAAWLDLIGEWVRANDRLHHVCTINPEFVMVAQRDPIFRIVLRRADLCVPDGIGLIYAARWLGKQIPERVTGSDGLPRIAERAAQEGWRLYLLGAAEGVAEKAADVLRGRYPSLKVAGTFSGSPRADEEAALVERVNASGADILFVAFGAPEQDKWIARNSPRLNVKMAMGVGGSFDFVAGIIPRAPLWMRNAGIEWLYRLYLQPWRIMRMMRLPRFVLAVIRRRSKGAWEP